MLMNGKSCLIPLLMPNVTDLNKGYNVGWFEWSFFIFLICILFSFVVAIFDLVHDVGDLSHLP